MRHWLALLVLLGTAGAACADTFIAPSPAGDVDDSHVPTQAGDGLPLKLPQEQAAPVTAALAATWRGRAASYAVLIERTAKRRSLQPALLRAIIAVESGFNARAVSRAGAQGLMQLQPATARRYGVGDAFDPEQNLDAGARYLAELLRRYGDNLELALAAYNAGALAVDRNGGRVPPYRETRAYIPAVLELYRHFLRRDEG